MTNKIYISIIACLLVYHTAGASEYQRIIENFEQMPKCELSCEGSAKVSEIKHEKEKSENNFISFDFDLGPKAMACYDSNRPMCEIKPENIYEAEAAKINQNNVLIYDDPQASGGKALSAFGDTNFDNSDDYAEFLNLPAAHQLIIYYTNGSGQTNKCGLYINNKRAATLEFPDTGNWQSEYKPVVYNGYIYGTIKLQTDLEDRNHNLSFCCKLDRIALSNVESDKGVAKAKLVLESGSIKSDDSAVIFLVKSNKVPLTVILQDIDGNNYKSVEFRKLTAELAYVDANSWDRFTILFDDFEPPILAEMRSKINSVCFELNTTGRNLSGNFAVREIIISKGWPSTAPLGCPLAQSDTYQGLSFTGRHAEYTGADTWYPSWASDGNMYSPYTDGVVDGLFSRSDGPAAVTGMAVIKGDDPLNLQVRTLGIYTSRPAPLGTRYPCGSLVYNGVWYYGTYNIGFPADPEINTYALASMGPFVGFRYSKDYSKTWTETPCTPTNNLFDVKLKPEGKGLQTPVKIGAPHFVDFGKNMENSSDGKAYIVGHGTSILGNYKAFTWTMGDEINIARITPSPENINDLSKYEFFAGFDKNNKPQWTNNINEMKPIVDWLSHAGCVTATYNPVLKKYFMCVTTAQVNVYEAFDTYILEADAIEGPYKMICYMEDFGRQAYFVNIPSKFISNDGKTMWLCYSANYTGQSDSPRHGRYAMSLREFRLMEK